MKLLLVDDDEIERTALRDILHAQGSWEIVEAPDGQRAFDLLCVGLEPEFCFFDVRMPKIDGLQLLMMIRQEQSLRHLKAVITSSSRDREIIVAVGKLGISGYLLKPYTQEKTTHSLKQILGDAPIAKPALTTRNLLGKSILIVDDDELTRMALRGMLDLEENWEVLEAKDGLDALEQLRRGLRPDLILMDLHMPRLDGHNLLARIREDPALRQVPVLIVSGQQDRDRIRALVQLRISGYLLKPFDANKVRAAVKQALGLGAAKKEENENNEKIARLGAINHPLERLSAKEFPVGESSALPSEKVADAG